MIEFISPRMYLKKRSSPLSHHLIPALLLAIAVAGCSYTREVSGRFYNLNDTTMITATLSNFSSGFGELTATMPNGEHLAGVYSFSVGFQMPSSRRLYDLGETQALKKEEAEKWSTWPEEYGFGTESRAAPVGTATLHGDRGTVIEVVFYTINSPYQHADGIARDNKGNRYRVYVGELVIER